MFDILRGLSFSFTNVLGAVVVKKRGAIVSPRSERNAFKRKQIALPPVSHPAAKTSYIDRLSNFQCLIWQQAKMGLKHFVY